MTTIDTFGIIRNAKLIGEATNNPDAADALAMQLARTVASTLKVCDAQFNDIETAICRIAVATRMINDLRVFKSHLRVQSAINSKPLADTMITTSNALTDIVKQSEALLKTTLDGLV